MQLTFTPGSRPGPDKPGDRKETKMKIIALIARLRTRTQRRPLDIATLSVRDWADLPPHHPRVN